MLIEFEYKKEIFMRLRGFIFTLAFFFFLGGMSTVGATEKENDDQIIEEANKVAEEYGLTPVVSNVFEGERLSFDSVEEFEEFLEKQEQAEKEEQQIQLFSSSTPSFCETNLTGQICVEAKVDRNSSGMITGVSNIHSYQKGVIFGITWSELYTDYSYTTRSGSAWAVGEKTYGLDIDGIPAGYTKKHTLTVNF